MTDKPHKPFSANLLEAARAAGPTKVNGPDSTGSIIEAIQQLNSPITEAVRQAGNINKLFNSNSDILKKIAATAEPLQELMKKGGVLQQINDPFSDLHKTIKHTYGLPSQTKSLHSPPNLGHDRTSISNPKDLGALIKRSRVAKKLTQQQLADLAGVGRRFLIECEAGKPRLEFAKVLQVAAAAGIDIFATKR